MLPLIYSPAMSGGRDQESIEEVARRLSAATDVSLAIVFGSAAAGKQRADSDVDIGIVTNVPLSAARRRELVELVADATGRAVDLIDLRTAGVPVTRAALRTGRVLFSKTRSAWAELLSKTLLDVADFLPYRERILRERRRAWIR